MSLLPDVDRIRLGPGPSLTPPRVMRAMASPIVSHLDPIMLALLDDVRGRLLRMFRADEGSFAFAVSGAVASGMETIVSNLVRGGTRALVVVTGYFGDRLAQMRERYGAAVSRLDVEWGRACDPDALRRNHQALVDGLKAVGLSLVAPPGERLWTLNAVRVPASNVDEAAIRKLLLQEFNIEIGAGLGPLAGKIWRVGLMGASSSERLVVLPLEALTEALVDQRHRVPA